MLQNVDVTTERVQQHAEIFPNYQIQLLVVIDIAKEFTKIEH